ncbi:MAG: phenylacetate--CoA ligase family protein [Desulfobacterales bacterium]
MKKTFMPGFRDLRHMEEHQLAGLKWSVSHAYQGSSFYQKRFDDAGVRLEDIRSLADIRRLPFSQADDLRKTYPFPFLSVPLSRVVRVHASSGTTGKRKILTYTQKDIDDWANFFARCYEMAGVREHDRVQIAVGYGIWTAGVGFQLGLENLGAMAIPTGPGNIDMQCQFLVDLQPTVMCCTASMALLMAEEIDRRNLRKKIALKKIIFGSERSSDAMRRRIKELIGLEDMFDITGMTELWGPGAGLDCAKHEGIHYWADYYILEILDPDTLAPVPEGEIGEMVVTTLGKEASPLIRYRTRDLTRLIGHPCSCGNIFPMHDKILGRSDDMVVFRGVNIYPGQIDQILSSIPEIASEYQIVLDRGDDGKDYLTLKVECHGSPDRLKKEQIAEMISEIIKNRMLFSCTTEALNYNSLPRSEKKSKRVFDNRTDF